LERERGWRGVSSTADVSPRLWKVRRGLGGAGRGDVDAGDEVEVDALESFRLELRSRIGSGMRGWRRRKA
jgi:hypothetical protein